MSACDAANFAKTDDPGAYRPWWDTPGNLNCKSTSKLCPPFPSFWTQLRLDTVTTKAARPGQTGLGKVDIYTLHQSFPEDWYDTSPGLWLNSITRTGFGPGDTTGTLQSQDGVSFSHYTVGASSPLRTRLKDRQLPNLVLTGKSDQRPGFTRPRIGTVSTEYGGDIEVEYTGGCASEPSEDKGENNGTCYPVRWSPDGDERTPAKSWFNKYVVASVTETDKVTSHSKPVVTMYSYADPAWAKSDDEFTRPALRTYSDWRGHRQVTVKKGSKTSSEPGVPQSQSQSVTRYFLGIGGEVKDSEGKYTLLTDDAPQYAGLTAETITYVDSGGEVLSRTVNFPWSKETASRPRENEDATTADPLLAHRTGTKRSDEIQKVGSSWRAVRTLQMNGYAYANNSPVSHSDPTGLWIDDGTGHSEPHPDATSKSHKKVGASAGGASAKTSGRQGRDSEDMVADTIRHNAAVRSVAAYLSAVYWQNPAVQVSTNVKIPKGGTGKTKDGFADVVLYFDDYIFIWEVKSAISAEKAAPAQLDRYVRAMQKEQRKYGKTVQRGHELQQIATMDPLNPKQQLVAQSTRSRFNSPRTGERYQGVVGWWTRSQSKKTPRGHEPATVRAPLSVQVWQPTPEQQRSIAWSAIGATSLYVLGKMVTSPFGLE